MIRRQAGQFAQLSVYAASPDSVPSVSIYASDGSTVQSSVLLPPLGDVSNGVYGMAYRVTLDEGDYLVRYAWLESSTNKVRTELLRVLPGGDAEGAYRSMTFYEPPHAGFVVGELTSDIDKFRRNPRV